MSTDNLIECTNCDGTGRNSGWPHTKCPVCEGSGEIPEDQQ